MLFNVELQYFLYASYLDSEKKLMVFIDLGKCDEEGIGRFAMNANLGSTFLILLNQKYEERYLYR